MNTEELKEILLYNNVPQDAYSLEGGLPSDAYCIEQNDGRWHFYYSERGNKNTIGEYAREEDACEAFLKILKKEKIIKT